jgi:DNA-binding response OmpR family regulator
MMLIDETTDLNGKRIVVVEDDYLLATDMCRILRDHGATVLGPAPTPFYAMHLIGRKKIDAAVLDIWLHGTTVFEVADKLREQGVPIIFATGGDRSMLPGRFQDTPWLSKPFDRKKLVSELHAMTRRPAARPPMPIRSAPAGATLEAPVQIFARALARSMRPA